MNLAWNILDHTAPGWPAEVAALHRLLAGSGQPLVPSYFVETTFVKMGGRLAVLRDRSSDTIVAVGLLFPRAIEEGRPVYTLRLHALGPLPANEVLLASLTPLVAPAIIVLHLPSAGHGFAATSTVIDGFDIGAPGVAELPAVRRLRNEIWGGVADDGYPDDLHSAEFAPGTSLVARRAGQLAGFLLGFHRFGLAALDELALPYRRELAIESQVMGVAAAHRSAGLAATLKREQARQALARGIDLIHWTADPLQFPNAVLNFGKLRAVAGEFYRAYYPYRNALNRVSASRLGIVWLPRSARGQAALAGVAGGGRHDLTHFPGVAILNAGPRPLRVPAGAPYLALEIPGDWTTLQRDDPATALAWRATSDELLAARLGFTPDRYLITDVAVAHGRRYLVAQRYTLALLLP